MTSSTPIGLIDDLRRCVGPANVVAGSNGAVTDGMRRGRAALAALADVPPLAVVRPATTADVVAVLAVAARAGVPVVPYGGGTGLMGGAATLRAGITLDLRRMNAVVEVNAEDRTARAQAGVVIADLNAALAPHGLVCGHDPWTVPIATVGGAFSTNGLGYLMGRYGAMADQVLAVEAVLADGTVVRTRPAERTSTGPHLRRLFAGAEGTLAVVTELTLRVFPRPEAHRLAALRFRTFADGFAAVCDFARIGLRPAMVDFGGPPDREAGARRGGAKMVLAFEGYREEVDAAAIRALAICAGRGGKDLGPATAEAFWADRHVDARRLQGWRRAERDAPRPGEPGSAVFDYLHMYLPQSHALEFLAGATAIVERAGGEVGEWGLWHQPELISLALHQDTGSPEALARLRQATDAVLMLAQDLGGSMEYVHGAGLRLAHLMEREHGPGGIETLRRIKRALDPDGLLNPGKLGM
jgi:FAD/FMN-containing dehydrogenase